MSRLKRFQERTVERVLSAVQDPEHSRRFLIADEVGLGKTIVAREVVRRLALLHVAQAGRPLRVFYLCSNLSIAHQNRDRIMELDGGASTDVDRLTLVPARKSLPKGAAFHLYTLTAGTSFPDRQGRSRGGTAEERALLHHLLHGVHQVSVRTDWLRRGVRKRNWPGVLGWARVKPGRSLQRRFREVVLDHLGLERAHQLNAALAPRRRSSNATLELIGELRSLLARMALDDVRPDLIIFDEFQRFRDLMSDENQGRIAGQLIQPAGGLQPAVLLLSATPYKLFDSQFEEAFGDDPHHEQLLDLYGWLAGGREAGSEARTRLEAAFREYGQALRDEPRSAQTQATRKRVETLLRRHVARTERYQHATGQALTPPPEPIPAPLAPADLRAFKHVARSFAPVEGQRSYQWSSVPYWRSVPMPMQTLGSHYKPWKVAREAGRIPTLPPGASLREGDRSAFTGPDTWPHPQLRAMQQAYPAAALSLPWVLPSRPWWPVRGPWAVHQPRKALLFSRFVAVPRAVSTLLSYDVERLLLQPGARATEGKGDPYANVTTTGRPFHFSVDNLAQFHPSPLLVGLVSPGPGDDPGSLRRAAATALKARLRGKATVVRGAPSMEYRWQVVGRTEARLGLFDASVESWRWLARHVSSGQGKSDDYSLEARVGQWADDASAHGPGLTVLSQQDFVFLVDAAVSHPAVVLARSIRLHWPDALGTAGPVEHRPFTRVLRTAWKGLRAYFNNAWFEARLAQAYDPPDTAQHPKGSAYGLLLHRAVVDGNLESLLDEHLFMTGWLRGLSGAKLCQALEDALALRVATPRLYEPNTDGFTLRAHAVMPFSQSVSAVREEGKGGSVRADELRDAFNSPFWPHVLVTTSIGQEGLDFHLWCDTIIHWDLPSNPVDLEQREGRVNRFGGLAVRTALADPSRFPDLCDGARSWAKIAARAERLTDPTGLSPWWVLEGATVKRRVFGVPLSEAERHFRELEEQRMLYRLTLGQPDQEGLVRALQGRVDPDEVRELAIDLG